MRISILLLLSTYVSVLGCAQSFTPSNNSIEIAGKYMYVATDRLSGITLQLNNNGSFQYSAGGDINSMYTSGKWSLNKDTLIINSSIDRKNIPISIHEEVIDSIKKNIKVALVYNLKGDLMDDAVLVFNGDTTRECIPFLESGCDKRIGSINKLRLELNNNVSSKWVRIKNKKANLIKVIVDIDSELGSYLFLVNQTYLYKNGKLYPLPITEITELNLSGESKKRQIALEKSAH